MVSKDLLCSFKVLTIASRDGAGLTSRPGHEVARYMQLAMNVDIGIDSMLENHGNSHVDRFPLTVKLAARSDGYSHPHSELKKAPANHIRSSPRSHNNATALITYRAGRLRSMDPIALNLGTSPI